MTLDSNTLITWMRRSYLSRMELTSIFEDYLTLKSTITMNTNGISIQTLTISLKLNVNQREFQGNSF